MPTYEYRCKKGHVFERLQTMNEAPLKRCEKCKSSVERLIGSGAGLIFKGTGFYSTDYKKSKSPSPAGGGSASGGKPDSKPSSPAKSEPPSKTK